MNVTAEKSCCGEGGCGGDCRCGARGQSRMSPHSSQSGADPDWSTYRGIENMSGTENSNSAIESSFDRLVSFIKIFHPDGISPDQYSELVASVIILDDLLGPVRVTSGSEFSARLKKWILGRCGEIADRNFIDEIKGILTWKDPLADDGSAEREQKKPFCADCGKIFTDAEIKQKSYDEVCTIDRSGPPGDARKERTCMNYYCSDCQLKRARAYDEWWEARNLELEKLISGLKKSAADERARICEKCRRTEDDEKLKGSAFVELHECSREPGSRTRTRTLCPECYALENAAAVSSPGTED